MSGGSEEAAFKLVLDGSHLQGVLTALTQDANCVDLEIVTKYDSLEGIGWMTTAVYELRCKLGESRRRLNSFRSTTDDFAQLWQKDAAVALDVDVQNGSWRHKRT